MYVTHTILLHYTGIGATAVAFANDLTEEEIMNLELGLTFFGKKVLARVKNEITQNK